MTNMVRFLLLFISSNSVAAEIQYQFNSPAFSGTGYSSHALTLQQLETQASTQNQAAAEAIKQQAISAASNTPQAQFLANLQSRIYSQLAQQLTNSMFSDGASCTVGSGICGSIPDLGGNSISWQMISGPNSASMIQINIQNASSGQSTSMQVPAGTFYF